MAASTLPQIKYTLRTRQRYKSIGIFFGLLFIEAGILPLLLFYSLKWGAHLSITKNLAIITSLVGTFSGLKFAQRLWYLWFAKDSHERRPIGAGRWGVDASHVMISIGLFAFFVPLVIGSSLSPASVPVVSMAIPLFMLTLCVPLLITGLFPREISLPFRVSSLPAHEVLPPATYTLVEDIVAVDGSGCLAFRQAWRERYEASVVMRRLLRDLSIAWGGSGSVVAGAFVAISWTTADDVGYGISYGLPWLWAMVCTALTIAWVKRELAREAHEWRMGEGEIHKEVSLHIRSSETDLGGSQETKV